MKNITFSEKFVIISFIVISIIVLWLISPMGKVTLPLSNKSLEKELDFKLSKEFSIKDTETIGDYHLYHLYNEIASPHVLSILILDKRPLTINDLRYDRTQISEIKLFWSKPRFSPVSIRKCEDKKIDNRSVNSCLFKAEWPTFNNKNYKEGEIASFTKGDKSVFIMSSAAEDSYNSQIMEHLIKSIIEKEL